MEQNRWGALLVFFAILAVPVAAQTTTNFTATYVITGDSQPTETFAKGFAGTGAVGTLGNALLTLNASQALSELDYNSGVGPISPRLTLVLNRLDRINVFSGQGIQDPSAASVDIAAGVTGGTGAYAGATSPVGALRLTLTRTSTTPLRYDLSLTGSATVGGQALDLAITNAPITETVTQITLFDTDTGTCAIPPLGNGNLTAISRPDTNKWDDNVNFIEINSTCAFSAADSVRAFFTVNEQTLQGGGAPVTITGGTGAFAGAAGTAVLTNIDEGANSTTVTVTGNITQAGPTTPIITAVNTGSGPTIIAQNDWIEIKGTNLVPANTPAGGMFWSNAPEFAQGGMPTELGGVSVTVNGKPAYVWWFCSAATTPACATDQINVLTPLDDYDHQVAIVVKNGSATSGAFLIFKNATTPAFLLFDARGHPVATHADGGLVGPTALFPGASTPARRGETIMLWGVGFGLPTTPLVAGSSTQSGALPIVPGCSLAGAPVQVVAALVSPGLYQFNTTISDNAAAGESWFFCAYGNAVTAGVLVAVQ